MAKEVGIYKQRRLYYSERPPYFPPFIFEEYPFRNKKVDKWNEIYASLRQILNLLRLDPDRSGTREWNPFGLFISPGQTVLLKPNLVRHFSKRGDLKGMITHGSLIRAVADYAYIALNGKGRIVIADGPIDDADFEKIKTISGLDEIRRFYKDEANFDIEVYDLRQERVIKEGDEIVRRIKLKGDPCGYTAVDLGRMSEFKKDKMDYSLLNGAEGRQDIMYMHHNEARDEYLIANTLLNSDVVINIPKMKTHKRSGVTLSLKNMIGITGDRNWLPHFAGTGCGKDKKEACSGRGFLKRRLAGLLPKSIKEGLRDRMRDIESEKDIGGWYGNDIMWRTIIDLACIAAFADKKGVLRSDRQRRSFVIVDGIIGGERGGPLDPIAKPCGVLVAGLNEFCVDAAASLLMGFDPMKMPKFKKISEENLQRVSGCALEEIHCVSNVKDWDKDLSDFNGRHLDFKPHYGWRGHIEKDCGGRKG